MLLAAPTEEKKMTTARTEHIRFQGELQQGIQTIPTIERLEKEERHSSPTHPELGEK